jgi:Tfp pilus assembly protein PilO
MTGRDRLVVVVLSSLAVLGAVWLLLVAPERKQAAKLQTQVNASSAQLSTAEGQLVSARGAQSRYAAAYASLVRLGKAVPASQEVPALIYELAHATNQKNVDFTSISSGVAGSASAAAAAATAAATTGLTQMPFTFVFSGSYLGLYHLFQQLNSFTTRTASGDLQVDGRLLTIQSVKLAPNAAAGSPGVSAAQLTATITASAYVLAAPQGLTGGATPTSPTGATTVSSTGTSTNAPAPALVTANP